MTQTLVASLKASIMLTPASALNWEVRRSLRLPLFWTFLATLVPPGMASLSLVAARLRGISVMPEDIPYTPQIQLTVTILNFAICLIGIGYAVGLSVRQYSLPVTSRLLASVRLLTGAFCCAGVYVLFSALFNVFFSAELPGMSPALTFGVGFMVMYAAVARYRGNDARTGIAGLTVGVLLVFWIGCHFGNRWWAKVDHAWSDLTTLELVILSMVGVFSWRSLINSIDRDRRGMGYGRVNPSASSAADTAFVPRRRVRKFLSAWGALFWQEWRQDGALLPGAIVGLVTVAAFAHITWLLVAPLSMTRTEGVDTVLAIGNGFLPLCAIIPWFLGLSGLHGRWAARAQPWSTSQSTLPISDAALGWIYMMRIVASSLVAGLGVIVVGVLWCGAVGLIQQRFGIIQQSWEDIPMMSATYASIWVLTLWLVASFSSAATLTGRRWIAALPMTLVLGLIGVMVLGAVLPITVSPEIGNSIVFGIIVALLVQVALAYVVGIIYDVIRLPSLIAGFVLFLIAEGWLFGIYSMIGRHYTLKTGQHLHWGSLSTTMIVLVALVVAPPALLPLATYYNRHR